MHGTLLHFEAVDALSIRYQTTEDRHSMAVDYNLNNPSAEQSCVCSG